MRLPNGQVIMHEGQAYDPAKAHEYYLRTRKLKGRKKGSADPGGGGGGGSRGTASVTRTHQKQELAARIQNLEKKLAQLDKLIKTKEAALKRSKNPTAADKSKKARESKKYRDKHKSELAAKAKKAAAKSGGGAKGSGSGKPDSEKSIKDLKMLATRVRGQLHVAKAKLSAL